MCRSVCHELGSWFHADPIFVVVGAILIALSMFRLATRGRWLIIFAMLGGWIILAAALVLWIP